MKCVVSIGSNAVDAASAVDAALKFLQSILSGMSKSDIYSTPALGNGHGVYFNAVACGDSDRNADELNRLFKEYERLHGRDERARHSGIVPVDLDLVVFGTQILRQSDFDRDYFRIGYSQLSQVSDQG